MSHFSPKIQKFQAFSGPKDTFKKSPKAVCDRGFDLILSKLSSGLIADNAGKIEVKIDFFSAAGLR